MSNPNPSRRAWFAKLAFWTAAAAAPSLLSPALAQSKASKSTVHYRDFPKGNEMCVDCKFFTGGGMMGRGMMGGGMMGKGMNDGHMMGGHMGGECQVVEGSISPRGWCDLYARR